jgi:hypothetical protein
MSTPDRPEPPWARWLFAGIQAVICLVLLWTGWRVLSAGQLVVGAILLLVAGITTVLSIRRLRGPRGGSNLGLDERGELRSSEFDYLVWVTIGVPIVMIVGALVFVLMGPR